jgi:hypothetical protein
MTRIGWWLVDTVSRMLGPDEREAVRGDFAESGETSGQALRSVLGLVVRRQAALWKDWRPWLALVGLVAPLGVLLSLVCRREAHTSAIYLWLYLNNWTWAYITNPGARLDLIHYSAGIFVTYVTLLCWSWASGFMLGSLSRRTIPVNGALFCLVVLFAKLLEAPPPGRNDSNVDSNDAVFSLTFYSVMFPLILQAVLILLPAVWGMHQGRRLATLPPMLRTILWTFAIATITALAIRNWGWVLCSTGRFPACMEWALWAGYATQAGRPPSRHIPALPLALIGPVGYMAATAVRRRWRGKTAPA